MNFDPFDKVDGKYGAPMGRASAPPGNLSDVKSDRLVVQWQEGGDGYDKGGAYWGLPSNVYAVWEEGNGPETVQYVRACSFGEALDIVQGIELDEFTQAYIEAIYFTDGQGIDEDEFDADTQLSDEAFEQIKADCAKFQADAFYLLAQAYAQDGYDAAQAGHDFWITRNGHGAGFWDRGLSKVLGQALSDAAHAAGGLHPYKGDDGLVHMGAG